MALALSIACCAAVCQESAGGGGPGRLAVLSDGGAGIVGGAAAFVQAGMGTGNGMGGAAVGRGGGWVCELWGASKRGRSSRGPPVSRAAMARARSAAACRAAESAGLGAATGGWAPPMGTRGSGGGGIAV